MISFIKDLYIHLRFFLIAGMIIFLFVAAFAFPWILPIAKTALVIFIAVVVLDALLLFNQSVDVKCDRSLPNVFSLGNENTISIRLRNLSKNVLNLSIVDELPFQFQMRNNQHFRRLKPGQEEVIEELLRPVSRGEYHFGKVRIYVSTDISLLERRISFDLGRMIPVYPSIVDVKKYEFRATSKLSNYLGIKKIRRIGQSYEFEQISEYNPGDNYQSINWKATGKTRRLMVNKYTDEKSQPIYSFIDKSRYMKMPFNGMSLLDYAINASLVIANSALKKDDKAGLLTFSDKIESHVKADKRRNQLTKILDALYFEDETKYEANYEYMFTYIKKTISSRSLIFLFSNFDTIYALERVLPVLRKINKYHLLVVIVFENTELEEFYQTESKTVLDIYDHTIAQKVAFEKKQVIYHLQQHAIQVIYTKPEDLTLNTLNKYIELKSRGMI